MTTGPYNAPPNVNRFERGALIVGVVFAAALAVGFFLRRFELGKVHRGRSQALPASGRKHTAGRREPGPAKARLAAEGEFFRTSANDGPGRFGASRQES